MRISVSTPSRYRQAQAAARAITDVCAPGIIAATLLLVVAIRSDGLPGIGWGLLGALFSTIAPLTYIAAGVRSGRFTDIHVGVREHRDAVVGVCIASVVVGMGLLALLGAPRDVVAVFAAMLATLVAAGAITHWWKISVHTAVAGGTVTILTVILGPVLLTCWLLVALIGWSRVQLRDHTPAQAVTGAIIGGVVAPLAFVLVR
jgi:membrane-associated phospholipid phosphatase